MMRWFRMYAEAIDDPKLRLLAFEDRWHYVAVLCMKAEGMLDEHAASPNFNRMVAAKLGLAARDADEVRRRLIEAELVDEEWQPTGWGRRQYSSDTSADRTRKWRQKNQQHNGGQRHGDVTVTPPDTDTDTEPEKKRARKRATPPPKSFEITPDLEQWAQTEATGIDLKAETVKFLDYHRAKGNSLKDWIAAWRNWMRKAVEYRREKCGAAPDPAALPRGHPMHMRADEYAALDDGGKREAWQQWQKIHEQRKSQAASH